MSTDKPIGENISKPEHSIQPQQEVAELDDVASEQITEVLDKVLLEVSDKLDVSIAEHVTRDRRLCRLANGRLVWAREKAPVVAELDSLLNGLVSVASSRPISNEDVLAGEELTLFQKVKGRLNEEGINSTNADKGRSIEFDDPIDKDRALQVIVDELTKAAKASEINVSWAQHKGLNTTGDRVVKTELLRVSLDSDGQVVIERDPHKRLSVVDFEDTLTLKPKAGTATEAAIQQQKDGKPKLTPEQIVLVNEHKATESGARRFMVVEAHRLLDSARTPAAIPEVVNNLDTRLNEPVFEEPIAALKFAGMLDRIRTAIVASGGWMAVEDPKLKAAVWDSEKFAETLTSYDPTQSRAILRQLLATAHYYAEARVPEFTWGNKVKGNTRNIKPAAITEADRPKREKGGPNLAEIVGIPAHILPPSVLGVARALEMDDTVYAAGERQHRPNSVVVYGTTDFANPAELMMTWFAARSGGAETEAVYFADPTAHTVGSYLERILIPTVVALNNIDPATAKVLTERARQFQNVFNVSLTDLSAALQNNEFTSYITSIESIVGKHDTFTALYNALNTKLAADLGIEYSNAHAMLQRTGITIGDVKRRIEQISLAAAQHYERLTTRLRDAGVPEDRIKNMMKSLFGDGSWSANTRQFLRTNVGNERGVSLDDFPEETKLADLANLGITLGGNAWVVVMGMARIKDKELVVGHKNTRQGGNYVMGASNDSRMCVSPVVRVIPGGNSGSNGDGLDIGAYLLHPELQGVVASAFEDSDLKVRGGQSKVVVEIAPKAVWLRGRKHTITTIEIGREPMEGGRRSAVQTSLLKNNVKG